MLRGPYAGCRPASCLPTSDPDDAAELRRTLARLPGVDLERGLRGVKGNPQTLARLLRMFATSHVAHADNLGVMVAARDYAQIRSIAHGLKGSAGQIGATSVAAAASALDAAFREAAMPEQIDLLCRALRAELEILMEGLHSLQRD